MFQPTSIPRPRMPDRQTAEKLFLEHLDWINKVAAMTCRQHGVLDEDAEEFASWIQMKVMEDEYAIIRNHRGESSLKTYLATVVNRQFYEHWRQKSGRWRPSAEAERRGPPAPALERLVYREGYTLEQAGQKLRTDGQTALSDRELAGLLSQLPERGPMRPVEVPPATRDEVLEGAPDTSRADDRVTAGEAREHRAWVKRALARAMRTMGREDRIIAKMHLKDGYSVADVARALRLEQKPLYRRVERLRKQLRRSLEEEGIRGSAVLHDQEDA